MWGNYKELLLISLKGNGDVQ